MNIEQTKKLIEQLISQDRYPEALTECSRLFNEVPGDVDNLETFRFLFTRIQEGNADFEPENTEQYVMRGIGKFYRGEISDSINDFDIALKLDPKYHYALKCRAFSYTSLGKLQNAVNDLLSAIDIYPDGVYYDDLAEINSNIGRIPECLYFHSKAIEASPDDPRLWHNFAIDLAENGFAKESLEKFDKAIELWPEYADAIMNRQYVVERLKKIE